jgi:hypothetical protein
MKLLFVGSMVVMDMEVPWAAAVLVVGQADAAAVDVAAVDVEVVDAAAAAAAAVAAKIISTTPHWIIITSKDLAY